MRIDDSRRHAVLIISALLLVVGFCLVLGSCANAADTDEQTQSPQSEQLETAQKSEGIPASKSKVQDANSVANESTENSESVADDELIVRFIDVGEGDCALITCGGKSLLVDGGPSDASSKVYSILKRLNIEKLDYIVATHPDADHCGGISAALTAASCGTFYCSTTTSDTSTFADIVKRLDAADISITVPSSGDSFQLGSATVTFLGPFQTIANSENNNSLVIRIDHGSKSFLLEGDAEQEEESSLVNAGVNLKADVLKVAHHGSSTSSTLGFLEKVAPSYAVISVGSNSYGHPTAKTLTSLAQISAETLRTDELGSIIMKSDGNELTVSSTKGNVDE